MKEEHVTPKTSNGTRAYYHDAGLMVLAADYEKADQTTNDDTGIGLTNEW